jgi:hypothetical protein
MTSNIIGLSGIATSGKDFFFSHLKYASKKNFIRYALADALKEEVYDMVRSMYNIDVFNCSPKEKETIRPFLIEHGKIRRKETNGRYWVDKITEKVKAAAKDSNNIVVITDIRYAEYDNDELQWLKNELNGYLVCISKYYTDEKNGEIIFAKPVYLDESKNMPILMKHADYILEWPNNIAKKDAIEYCSDVLVSMRLKKISDSLLTSSKNPVR